MFLFMSHIVSSATANGTSLSVLFLSYDLAPGAIYPRQLQQAAAILSHTVTTLKKSPRNIIFTGDSAGANLALSLLSHLKHPHPSGTVMEVDLKGEEIKGAVLISPWVDFSTDSESWTRNKYKDVLCAEAGNQWSSAFLGEAYPHTKTSDYYNQATTAPESWWEGLPVEKILIVAGEEEVLVDGIVKFEGKLRKGLGEDRVELVVVNGEYHDQPSVDLQMGYKESEEGEQAKLIKRWIGSKL
jgi:acetyl esterase/lipase